MIEPEKIDEAIIESHLDTAGMPDPDLLSSAEPIPSDALSRTGLDPLTDERDAKVFDIAGGAGWVVIV